jgi:N-acetylglucosamine-6-phosphate deacetylase
VKTGESMTTVFHGAEIFDGARLHAGAALVVEDGEVGGIVPRDEAPAGPRVHLDGGVLAPGFVDLQVNGGGGVMLNDRPDLEGIRTICEAHGRLGTTGLMPTLITDTPAVTRAAVEGGLAAAEAGVPGFLGLHLEGPHLDPRRKGAHDPALIRPMQAEDLELLCDAARRLPALIVTVAPESVTAAQVAALAAAGAVVSLGHSDTAAERAEAVFAAGAGMVTHLFNAMSQLGNREPGLVGAALAADAVRAGLIADGIHVAPTTMRMALAAKPADGIFLVTDAMAVAGTELTEFTLNGRRILRRDGRLTLADGTLAGADIDFAGAIRVLVGQVGVTLSRALRMATAVPAACLGLGDRLGRLAPGLPADLVHLDAGLGLAGVWRGGASLL